jgi:hypothetical protein
VVKDVNLKMDKTGKFLVFKYTFLQRHKFNMVVEPVDSHNARFAGLGYFVGDKVRWEEKGDRLLMYWSGLILEKKQE